jgi:hypothetical protein
MFKFLKSLFAINSNGENNMENIGIIAPLSNGRTGLFVKGGDLIQSYARARDARRGAARHGLVLA